MGEFLTVFLFGLIPAIRSKSTKAGVCYIVANGNSGIVLTVPANLHQIVADRMKALGLSRYELARRSGLPQRSVYAFTDPDPEKRSQGSARLIMAILAALELEIRPKPRALMSERLKRL